MCVLKCMSITEIRSSFGWRNLFSGAVERCSCLRTQTKVPPLPPIKKYYYARRITVRKDAEKKLVLQNRLNRVYQKKKRVRASFCSILASPPPSFNKEPPELQFSLLTKLYQYRENMFQEHKFQDKPLNITLET